MANFSDRRVDPWLERSTFHEAPGPLEALLARKHAAAVTVGVCLPALDEESTVGPICSTIHSELVSAGFVDQLVVVDSGSTDRTASEARDAGATVFRAADLVPDAPVIDRPGKGESLWKSLSVLTTDIVVWVDSDTRDFTSEFVTALVAPLLFEADLVMTKAFYDRPFIGPGGLHPKGGARVTEIAARPLINLLCPELAGFIQPLSGEYGGRREALIDLPFGTGYDVDLLLVLEVVDRYGLESIAQVDLGHRTHRNREISELGRMSFEIVRTLLARLDDAGTLKLSDELPQLLTQFTEQDGIRTAAPYVASSQTRPPMRTFLEG